MAALTQAKDIVKYGVDAKPSELPMGLSVKGAVNIFKGALVANQGGFARPARSVASNTDIVLGVAGESVDNSAGADGAKSISHVIRGVFAFANLSGDLVTTAAIGAVVYAADDQTVALGSNSGARVAAGKCVGFDGSLVLVEVG